MKDQETVPVICNVGNDVTVANNYYQHLFIFLSLSAFREMISIGLEILASFCFFQWKTVFYSYPSCHTSKSILQHVPEKILLSSSTGFVLHTGDILNINFHLIFTSLRGPKNVKVSESGVRTLWLRLALYFSIFTLNWQYFNIAFLFYFDYKPPVKGNFSGLG